MKDTVIVSLTKKRGEDAEITLNGATSDLLTGVVFLIEDISDLTGLPSKTILNLVDLTLDTL